MPTVEFIDRMPALRYIARNGYASYSSLCLYKNGEAPKKWNPIWGIFGTELHSRFLEGKMIVRLTKDEERHLKEMLTKLREHPIVTKLMQGSKVEQEFKQELFGVTVLGYIDILNVFLADLKSTKIASRKVFIESMNFLQAALYMAVTGRKDFYYIGVMKQAPYTVMVFNVRDYPDRLKAAKTELKKLLGMLKKDLKKIPHKEVLAMRKKRDAERKLEQKIKPLKNAA